VQTGPSPRSTVIPELAYPDVGQAIDWLCDVLGVTMRIRIGNHRAQLNVGDGAIVLTELPTGEGHDAPATVDRAHSVRVRVEDVNGHHERVTQRGVRVLRPPASHPYGERQYTVEHFGATTGRFPNRSLMSLRRNGARRRVQGYETVGSGGSEFQGFCEGSGSKGSQSRGFLVRGVPLNSRTFRTLSNQNL
jgi:uncharacterized glyoxalase superfamily protein PhnB